MPSLLAPILPFVFAATSREKECSRRLEVNRLRATNWQAKLVEAGSGYGKESCSGITEVLPTRSSLFSGGSHVA